MSEELEDLYEKDPDYHESPCTGCVHNDGDPMSGNCPKCILSDVTPLTRREMTMSENNKTKTADERRVNVCGHCLKASCFHGHAHCPRHLAKPTTRTVGQLKILHREDPSFWGQLVAADGGGGDE